MASCRMKAAISLWLRWPGRLWQRLSEENEVLFEKILSCFRDAGDHLHNGNPAGRRPVRAGRRGVGDEWKRCATFVFHSYRYEDHSGRDAEAWFSIPLEAEAEQ